MEDTASNLLAWYPYIFLILGIYLALRSDIELLLSLGFACGGIVAFTLGCILIRDKIVVITSRNSSISIRDLFSLAKVSFGSIIVGSIFSSYLLVDFMLAPRFGEVLLRPLATRKDWSALLALWW